MAQTFTKLAQREAVAAAPWVLQRKLLPHPSHEFCPGNPGGVVGARRVIRVAAASVGMTVVRMSAGGRLTVLADIANGQRRDGGPELVIRCKYAVIPVPMLARRRDQIRGPV